MSAVAARVLTVAASATVAAGVLTAGVSDTVPTIFALTLGFAVVLGWLIVAREPTSPVGPALAWCSASVAVVNIDDAIAGPWAVGVWPVNLVGLFVLLLVFPEGPLQGRLWRGLPWAYAAATAGMIVAEWGVHQVGDRLVGTPPPWRMLIGGVAIAVVGASLMLAVVSVVVRYRSGGERIRLQIRWLMLAGAAVVVLLMAGWMAQNVFGATTLVYVPFLFAIVLLVPLAVAVAVTRHDLFDIDRLLGQSVIWFVTLACSAAVFSLVVVLVSQLVHEVTAAGSAAAAFVTALALLPLHRLVNDFVGRLVDPDRYLAVAAVERFAADVRAGRHEPEEIEQALRDAQGDPQLTVLLASRAGGWVGMNGAPVAERDGFTLEVGGDAIARIVLGWDSARARRRVGDLAKAAWVPVEVSRLRLVLRDALEEARASRARLAEAGADERRRIARDLHDGAQQRIVATGMRLRLLQQRLASEPAAEVDAAVAELQQTVDELRRLASGLRPSRLDDGLEAALSVVREATPIPFDLEVGELPVIDDTRALTAYLVVSEAVANALKHAGASRIGVTVASNGDRLAVVVADNGIGGVPCDAPLPALRDRVLSVGGTLGIVSAPGEGTTITAVI